MSDATLQGCIDGALEDLRDRIEDGLLDEPYAEDALHEIADGAVPIYTADVFQIAADSPAARYPDDSGLCDPERGAEHVIQVAIYEQIYAALAEALQEARDEAEEDDEEEEDADV